MCQELYCSFPGYIEHGKILLVGNMGLYDYRPYVKKVNDKIENGIGNEGMDEEILYAFSFIPDN